MSEATETAPRREPSILTTPIGSGTGRGTGEGMDLLVQAIDEYFSRMRFRQVVTIPVEAGGLRAKIYQRFSVLNEEMHETGDWSMEIEGNQSDLAWLNEEMKKHSLKQVKTA